MARENLTKTNLMKRDEKKGQTLVGLAVFD